MPSSETCRQPNRVGSTFVNVLVVLGIIGLVIALFLPPTRTARPAARRVQCRNNLKQIALALHNYHDAYDAFPPAYTVDADGRPLHSWRTLILPYLGEGPLYKSIDLTKPWDHPANAAAVSAIPSVYRCPSAKIPPDSTTYVGLVGPTACFRPDQPRQLSEISPWNSGTAMVIEVSPGQAVPWMAPRDPGVDFLLSFGEETEFDHAGGTMLALADGGVRFVNDDISHEIRRALISIDGGVGTGDW